MHCQNSLQRTGKGNRLVKHQVVSGVGDTDHRYMPTAALTDIVRGIVVEQLALLAINNDYMAGGPGDTCGLGQ